MLFLVTVCTKTSIVYANRLLSLLVTGIMPKVPVPWICSRCKISDQINDRDAQKMVTIHSASRLEVSFGTEMVTESRNSAVSK